MQLEAQLIASLSFENEVQDTDLLQCNLKAIHEMFGPMCSRLIFAIVKKVLLCTPIRISYYNLVQLVKEGKFVTIKLCLAPSHPPQRALCKR